MFNYSKCRKLEDQIERCLREYSKAQAQKRVLRNKIADLALEGKEISEDLRKKLNDVDWDLEYFPTRLNEIKVEYINLINQVDIPTD